MTQHFDWKFYLAYYPELKKNGLATQKQAQEHYNRFGKNEGRIGNKNEVDWQFYLNKYPDLKKAGLKTMRGAKLHYTNYGVSEGRIPNRLFESKNKSNIEFNILIRCTYRPTYFKKCIESVLFQTHKLFNVIMCYDDERCMEYLQEYKNHPKIHIFKAPEVNKGQPCFYNLYCNFLLKKVKDGWILFLDDDDMFSHKNTLHVIANNIETNNDCVFWQVKLGNTIVFPPNIHDIQFRQISGIGFCFHSLQKNKGQWAAQHGSDYKYISEVLKANTSFKRKQIHSVLTRTQHSMNGQYGLYDKIKLEAVIKNFDIKQGHVSESLIHLKHRFLKKYSLTSINKNNAPALFFGVYNKFDIETILNHGGDTLVIFGGSDVSNIQAIKAKNNIRILSISRDMQTRLSKYNICSCYVLLNMVDSFLFKPVPNKEFGKKIFIYNGYTKKKDNSRIYNQPLINEVVKRCPNKEFIFSNDLGAPYEKMPEIYKQCYIGLRLTNHDGNANMVQEMEAMKIPVVHNHSEYGLKWKTVEDVVGYINNIIEKITITSKLPQLNEHSCNLYSASSLPQGMLNDVYSNISVFDSIVEKYNNILFICGDYPGYGGAATNCSKLQKHYEQHGHSTFAFYYNFETGKNAKYEHGEGYVVNDLAHIRTIKFRPDLIILKSFIGIDIRKIFSCPVFYLIGGIYKNNLDKYYYHIKDKKEHDKYVNRAVLKQIKNSDYSFCNSSHTREILKNMYGIETNLFYSSFVPYYNKQIEIDEKWNKREYDYGLIMSDFNRPIKNAGTSIEFLKNKKNVILIGKNSNKYKNYGFKCIELVDKDRIDRYYKKIKYIVQDSFYESCSNVRIEGLFNGCKIHEKKLFIFSSTQLPGNGGAATNCLYLHEYVKNNLQHDSIAVFFSKDIPSKDHIRKDIYILDLRKEEKFSEFKYQILRKYNEKNIICLCKNVVAPQKMKQIFPLSKVIYLVAGCPSHTYWATLNHISFVKYKKNLINMEITEKDAKKENMMNYFNNFREERKAIQLCDEILTNNNGTKEVLLHHYKDHKKKFYNISINTSNLRFDYPNISQQDFDKRDIDIIFAVSKHTRVSKGSAIMNKIITNNNIDNLTKVVIGNDFEKIFHVNKIKNCSFFSQLSQSELFSYLKRSKIVVIPSTGDASPNILYEGLHLGCNILLTKNCGNYELFPDISVLEDVDNIDLFIKHICLLKDYPIDYNIQNDRKKFNNYLEILSDSEIE